MRRLLDIAIAAVVATLLAACGAPSDVTVDDAAAGSSSPGDDGSGGAAAPGSGSGSGSGSDTAADDDTGAAAGSGEDRRASAGCGEGEAPAGVTERVVSTPAQRPSIEQLEALMSPDGLEDMRFMAEQEGGDEESWLRRLAVQTVSRPWLEELGTRPDLAQMAYCNEAPDPYVELTFVGDAPDLDVPAEVAAVAPVVVREGVATNPDELFAIGRRAAQVALGLGVDERLVEVRNDPRTGSVQVLLPPDATDELLAEVARLVADDRVEVGRIERFRPCDDEVVAAADADARPDAALLPQDEDGGDVDGRVEPDRAARVRSAYRGLSLDAAEQRAAAEGRPIRVGILEGVGLATTDDLSPGRLTVEVCRDVIIDVEIDGAPR